MYPLTYHTSTIITITITIAQTRDHVRARDRGPAAQDILTTVGEVIVDQVEDQAQDLAQEVIAIPFLEQEAELSSEILSYLVLVHWEERF